MPAYYDEEEGFAADKAASGRRIVSRLGRLVGAGAALVLIAGGAYWGLGLTTRDTGEIPVIRAAAGPVKVRPAETEAGGEQVRHAQVAAYDAGTATDVVTTTALGAGPSRPADEDLPAHAFAAAAPAPGSAAAATMPEGALTSGRIGLNAPAQPFSINAPDPGAQIAALTLDEGFLAPEGMDVPRAQRLITSEADLLNTRRPERVLTNNAAPVPPRGEGSDYAPPVSPLVRARPVGLEERFAVALADDAEAEKRAALTRAAETSSVQIQLGAFPEREKIEAEWARLQGENDDILGNRALAVQQTVSGGIVYYRLRVGPFRGPQEASTVCQALKARGYDCLLAINTESRG
ncbi:MAG: SPOR domain-containing protein [Pseudomonadota bacterium]